MMMRELDRGELLDRLPEYVRGTLSADERRAVDVALAKDPDMVRELDVIRASHAALTSRASTVNVEGILAAIKQPAPVRKLTVARWRIAAAVATLAVGGASLAVLQQTFRGYTEPPTIVGESASVANTELSISFGYDLSELTSEDLEKLVNELKQSGGIPSAEPTSTGVTLASEGIQ
jgi:anti-sigma factor RsiW